ncbi:MAG: hypothetical protein ACKPKO_40560, partial [Candidatus Fonsibacter sp.]
DLLMVTMSGVLVTRHTLPSSAIEYSGAQIRSLDGQPGRKPDVDPLMGDLGRFPREWSSDYGVVRHPKTWPLAYAQGNLEQAQG